jgi:hypothetical protein
MNNIGLSNKLSEHNKQIYFMISIFCILQYNDESSENNVINRLVKSLSICDCT